MGTFLVSKVSVNVINVKLFLHNSKIMMILDLWDIRFCAVVVFSLGKDLLFKSVYTFDNCTELKCILT